VSEANAIKEKAGAVMWKTMSTSLLIDDISRVF